MLDTWFSSGLWPMSTLGWPEETADFARYYPTSLLITGFDIIFFWVARMMMLGLEFMDDVPFRDVYITTLVRDEYGKKMTKSKGNVVTPMGLLEQYGTDAVRYWAASGRPGADIAFEDGQMRIGRKLAIKILNASRFVLRPGTTTPLDVAARLFRKLGLAPPYQHVLVRGQPRSPREEPVHPASSSCVIPSSMCTPTSPSGAPKRSASSTSRERRRPTVSWARYSMRLRSASRRRRARIRVSTSATDGVRSR